MNPSPEPIKPRSFRLHQADVDRLGRLASELHCSQADVINRALVALRIAIDAGYDFSWAGGPGLVLQSDPEAGVIRWHQIGDDDALTVIGEQPMMPKAKAP